MQIQRVTLSKWCQLDGEFEFGPGLNSIRGPNGSGKTNLVNAVVFALTGDISRLHGVKADNINIFAEKKDKAFVSLQFSHENVTGSVTRVLQPNPRQELILDWSGQQKKFTRDAEIAFELEKLLGVNQKMLLDYVFVQQWGIFKFIDQQPAVRARALAELFGADRAERIYKELGEVKVDIPSASVDADIVRARMQQNKQELTGVVAELKRFAGMEEKIENEVKEHRKTVAQWERKKGLLGNIENMNVNRTSRKERMDALLFEIEPLEQQVADLQSAIDDAASQYETAREGLVAWKQFEAYTRNRAGLLTELQTMQTVLDEHTNNAPIQPVGYVVDAERKALDIEHAKLQAEVQRYQQVLTAFAKGDKAECPTCGTPVDQLHDRFHDYDAQIKEIKPTIQGIARRLAVSDAFNNEKRQHADRQIRLVAQIESRQKVLNDLKQVEQPDCDVATYQQLVNTYEATLKDLNYRKETVTIGHGKTDRMQAEIKTIDDMMKKDVAEAYSIGTTEMEAEIASKLIDQSIEQFITRDTLRNRKRDIERLIEDDTEALDKCQATQLRAEHLQQTATHLEEVRAVYRELITVIPQHNLEMLRSEVNDILNKFGVRFRIDAINDLQFLLRYHSGRIQPAERLSGGERVLLALAFRIVVNSRYAKELGLLSLDEPTAGLDEDNLNCLEVALGCLREMSQARGLQVIMVTHDSGLDGLFDRVIQLQAAS